MTKAQWVRTGYTIANTYIALAILLFFSKSSSPFLYYIEVFLLRSLFLLIPVLAAILWFLNRHCRNEHSKLQKKYLIVSRIILGTAWIYSGLIVSVWVLMTQPWPFTLREGPDTNYARKGFEQHLEFVSPTSVSQIYYHADEGFTDQGYLLRFTYNDPATVTQAIQHLQLHKTNNPESWILNNAPKWWTEKSQYDGLACFTGERTNRYYFLWYDSKSRTVWYEKECP